MCACPALNYEFCACVYSEGIASMLEHWLLRNILSEATVCQASVWMCNCDNCAACSYNFVHIAATTVFAFLGNPQA